MTALPRNARARRVYARRKKEGPRDRNAARKANPSAAREKARRYTEGVKNEVFRAYGDVCSCCGEHRRPFLTIDHVNDDGARETATAGYQLYLKIRRLGFPEAYRLLCYNCNAGRYRNGGVCPHKEEKMKTKIIALAGRAGSGKSTCSKFLEEAAGAKRFSIADPLKRLAQAVMGFSDAQLWGTQAEKEAIDPRYGMSARQFLIRLGDNARKVLGDRVWIDGCRKAIYDSGASLAVVEDLRYPNEAEIFALEDDATVIRLGCPDAQSSVDPNAPSEAGVDAIDPRFVAVELVATRSPGAEKLLTTFKSLKCVRAALERAS